MLGTNVLFDMPLTTAISNFLNKKDRKKINAPKTSTPITQTPKDKFKETFKIKTGGNS